MQKELAELRLLITNQNKPAPIPVPQAIAKPSFIRPMTPLQLLREQASKTMLRF